MGEERQLGRYTIVHELGHGGMANVYLARVRGPAAFHKWVAIKQIHPHLAKERHFVEMFLDEARIAASLQHPNVASVFDLGEEDGESYLTMEYLHGEHLGRLSFRAMREQGHLARPIAARIIADAARGLHHAHEARDAEGRPLMLIHRDVSPHNIFVTYDGQVKLTDFGVAKAANRLTHTETGRLKGKMAYMAPEQALGAELDRRVDIFALGVVLWEITVGRRLFKADTDAQTLMRIAQGKVPLPSSVWPDYPPELETIVMRALAFDASRRLPTAAVLAHELERYVASTGVATGSNEIAQLMRSFFSTQLVERERLLREGASLDEETTVSNNEVEEELPIGRSEDPDVAALPASSATPAPTTRPWVWAAVGAILVVSAVSGAAAGIAWLAPPDEEPGPTAEPPPEPAPASARIATAPSGARVTIDGASVAGTTPVSVAALAPGRHAIRLELAGYEPLEATFDLEEGDTSRLSYDLRPATPADDSNPEPTEPTEPTVAEDTPSGPRTSRRQASRPAAAATGTATLTVISLPWSRVSIDGGPAHTTPLRGVEVGAGRHELRYWVQGEEPPRTQTVELAPDETRTVRLATQ